MRASRGIGAVLAMLAASACFKQTDTLGKPCDADEACYGEQVCGVDDVCIEAEEETGDGDGDGDGDGECGVQPMAGTQWGSCEVETDCEVGQVCARVGSRGICTTVCENGEALACASPPAGWCSSTDPNAVCFSDDAMQLACGLRCESDNDGLCPTGMECTLIASGDRYCL